MALGRTKFISISTRFANSILSTCCSRSQTWNYSNQVTHLSFLSQFPSVPLGKPLDPCSFIYSDQRLFFSSSPDSIIELVLPNDWSKSVRGELEKLHPILTQETVIFVLKKLDKDPLKALDFFKWVSGRSGFNPSSQMYSLLLRILAGRETMKQFWELVKEMREKGCYVDEETYLTVHGFLKKEKMANDVAVFTHFYNSLIKQNASDDVVKDVLEVILGSDWDDEVENKLGKLQISVSDNFMLRAYKELRQHPKKLLNFFNWVGDHTGYEHNSTTYNGLARVLARHESIKEFWSIVKRMRGEGHEMDIDTYIKISRTFQKFQMLKDAVELYEFMMDGPYKPSLQDCSLLLKSISRNPDVDLVFRVVKKYEAAGHTLSKAVFDGIHRSLTSVGRFDEAEKIVEAMRNAGYEPDNITHSQVVFGLCKAGKFEEASKVLDEMEAQGCPPDIKTWTILIQGHCTSGRVDKALVCFAKMVEKNLNADADLLDVLIDGFLLQDKIVGAYTLLVEMVKKADLKPWQATYKLLIERLLEERKLEEALQLLRMMKEHGYPPFPEPIGKHIAKFGTLEDAREFLKALTVREHPSNSAYLLLFRAFFKEGRHVDAKDLLYTSPPHIRSSKEIGKLFGSAKSSKSPGDEVRSQ